MTRGCRCLNESRVSDNIREEHTTWIVRHPRSLWALRDSRYFVLRDRFGANSTRSPERIRSYPSISVRFLSLFVVHPRVACTEPVWEKEKESSRWFSSHPGLSSDNLTFLFLSLSFFFLIQHLAFYPSRPPLSNRHQQVFFSTFERNSIYAKEHFPPTSGFTYFPKMKPRGCLELLFSHDEKVKEEVEEEVTIYIQFDSLKGSKDERK